MSYQIKEVFYSLQGEGFHAGRAAIFCRFSKCNLWTGREEDRANAICNFCDTDFIGTDGQNGGKFKTAEDLAKHLLQFWPKNSGVKPYVILTGGEPLLQVDQVLVDVLHEFDFEIALETNGTKIPPNNIDWICVSPKAGAPFFLTEGNELKLVYPQPSLVPADLPATKFDYYYLQPMDCADKDSQLQNQQQAVEFCLQNPKWQLSLQTHKILQID